MAKLLSFTMGKSRRLATDAAKSFSAAARETPSVSLFEQGRKLEAEGRFSEAVSVYRQELEGDSPSAESALRAGLIMEGFGETDEALLHFLYAIALSPAYAEAHFSAGRCYDDMQEYDEAALHYRRALAIDPNHAVVSFKLGMLLARHPQAERSSGKDAVSYLRRYLQLNPESDFFMEARDQMKQISGLFVVAEGGKAKIADKSEAPDRKPPHLLHYTFSVRSHSPGQ